MEWRVEMLLNRGFLTHQIVIMSIAITDSLVNATQFKLCTDLGSLLTQTQLSMNACRTASKSVCRHEKSSVYACDVWMDITIPMQCNTMFWSTSTDAKWQLLLVKHVWTVFCFVVQVNYLSPPVPQVLPMGWTSNSLGLIWRFWIDFSSVYRVEYDARIREKYKKAGQPNQFIECRFLNQLPSDVNLLI